MRVAILQSDYLPWKGYFDIIHDVDLCVFYDCAQYTRQDWRNRNQYLLGGRKHWLSVPLLHAPLGTPISAMRIDNRGAWQRRHMQALGQAYGRLPYFGEVAGLLRPFLGEDARTPVWERLSDFNQALLAVLCGYLGIPTLLMDSAPLRLEGRGSERVLQTLKKVGATHYVSGPSAKAYLDEGALRREGIGLTYKDYAGYPEYSQDAPAFDHRVCILDLLFRAGREAARYIWGWRGHEPGLG